MAHRAGTLLKGTLLTPLFAPIHHKLCHKYDLLSVNFGFLLPVNWWILTVLKLQKSVTITEIHHYQVDLSLLPETRRFFPLSVKAVTLPLCSSKEVCWTTCEKSNPFHVNYVPRSPPLHHSCPAAEQASIRVLWKIFLRSLSLMGLEVSVFWEDVNTQISRDPGHMKENPTRTP